MTSWIFSKIREPQDWVSLTVTTLKKVPCTLIDRCFYILKTSKNEDVLSESHTVHVSLFNDYLYMDFLKYSLNKFHTVCVLDILICHLQGAMYMHVFKKNLQFLR